MKKYDIVVYGASGFTGKLVCEYLINHPQIDNIKWAIAGRDKGKLDKLSTNLKNIDVIVASSFDSDSLEIMCNQSKLIITTVGPYDIYGEKLIQSCIKNKTHYVDLTGEPQFVTNMINKYSKDATDNNVAIINCCGFESIPPDLGTYLSVKQLKSDKIEVNYFLQTKGTISGGTWASFMNSITSKQPIVKITKSNRSKKRKKFYYDKHFKKWAMIFPVIDKQIVMRTSKNDESYGKSFQFNEYILNKSYFGLLGLIFAIGLVSLLAKSNFLKKWLISLRPSGSGPSKKQQQNNWFKATILAKGEKDSITTIIKGKDPGYGETSKFISEIALCIILDYDKLRSKSGFLTPVQCTGDLLAKRLSDAGISITSS